MFPQLRTSITVLTDKLPDTTCLLLDKPPPFLTPRNILIPLPRATMQPARPHILNAMAIGLGIHLSIGLMRIVAIRLAEKGGIRGIRDVVAVLVGVGFAVGLVRIVAVGFA